MGKHSSERPQWAENCPRALRDLKAKPCELGGLAGHRLPRLAASGAMIGGG